MNHVHSNSSSRGQSKKSITTSYCLIFGITLSILLGNFLAVEGTVPSGFSETQIANTIWGPTAMALVPDGRILICEQGGSLRVVKNGVLLTTPFVTITVNSQGERGLLGVAIDPNFASNQYVYVYYTATTPNIHNRISRFTANGDVAAAGSELAIFDLDPLSSATNHNGGSLHFGQDGKLYAATGDNANASNSQSFNTVLGKLLRMNSDGTIPTDNPFYSTTTGNNRAIWALGLRNPFTFAVQPGTSRKFIDDVGQATYEEINDAISGANYGWPNSEGPTSTPGETTPLLYYGHGSGSSTGCAVTGGTFYNPSTVQFPASYVGHYFYADYCSGWIRNMDPSNNTSAAFATNITAPVDLFTDPNGPLFYLARGSGNNTGVLYRIDYTNSQAPFISTQPANVTVSVGQSASFSVIAGGTAPLNYQWQRNGSNISGATSATYTIPSVTMSDNGALFRCVVSNAYGTVTSNQALLTVSQNQPPTATINLPVVGSHYNGGQTITYSGTGTDPEDGNEPASAFTWEIVFHHDQHTHPFILPFSGTTGGTFVIPTTGETSPNVWYRIYLTITDSSGATATVYRDIVPNLSNVTLATNPSGLQLKLDAQPITSPYTFTGVVGITRNLEAVSPQSQGGTNYQYVSWSDGGARVHDISTPSSNTTYTATYQVATGGTGDGLAATYYDNKDLTGTTVSRIDPTVNFLWGTGVPAPGIGADTFSVRWTGKVQPLYSETYTFYTQSDDGVRLWVNNQQIINNWTDHGSTENASTPINLTAGQLYDIKMEFYENVGNAVAQLKWSSSSQSKAIIAMSQLYSQVGGGGTWQHQDIGNVGVAGSMTISGNTYTLQGSGADIWATSDAFQYAYQTLNGDGEVIARVSSLQNTNSWAKAGVMIRQSLSANSPHASMFVTVSNGLHFQYRATTNGNSTDVSGGTGAVPYWLRIARNQNTLTAYKSTDGTNWTTVGTATISMPTQIFIGLAVTSHNNSVLCSAVFDNVSLPGGGGGGGGLPAPWLKTDVGGVGVTGDSTYSGGTFTVNGSGVDIWNSSDSFHFAYQARTGDVTIIARVDSVENTNSWAKAGVMIRETLTSGSKHAFMALTPSNGLTFQRRTTTGGSSSATAGGSATAPYWVKLVRSGSTFTAYKSSDGSNWTQVGSVTISMSSNIYVGLAVTAHNNSTLCTTLFSNVSQ